MELIYKSEVIRKPNTYLVENLRETIFWLKGIGDTRDYVIKVGVELYNILDNEIIPGDHKIFMGVDLVFDDNIEDGKYCVYRKDKSIPIKLTPVKTLDEWFANLPLIYKLDLYNSMSGTITKHLK